LLIYNIFRYKFLVARKLATVQRETMAAETSLKMCVENHKDVPKNVIQDKKTFQKRDYSKNIVSLQYC